MRKEVTVNLSAEHALVLYDWLARFNLTGVCLFEDQAEQRALWDLEALLESKLVEPLEKNYGELVAKARAAVRDEVS